MQPEQRNPIHRSAGIRIIAPLIVAVAAVILFSSVPALSEGAQSSEDHESDNDPIPVNNTYQSPVAMFTVNLTEEGLYVFNGSNSTDPDGEIVEYRWFISGQNLYGQEVNLSFTRAGKYMVRLTVVDDEGETGESTISLTVDDDPSVEAASGAEANKHILLLWEGFSAIMLVMVLTLYRGWWLSSR